MKRLQIFRKGKHTASSGVQIEFSEADLRAAVAAYDPKLHEAPITVGHPKDNEPAYGWIKSLSFSDGAIEAEPDQVDESFAELVKQGKFKKISAAFYTPTSPANPKPGAYYLRHVGFLGAEPPAVKGLREVAFTDCDDGGVVEFADWSDMNTARMFRGLRDWILAKFGQDEADKALPNWPIDDALITAAQAPPSDIPKSFSEQEQDTMKTPEEIRAAEAALAARETKLQADEAAFAERNKTLSAQEAAAQRKAHADFVDGLVKAGKVLPVQREGIVAFMCGLTADAVVEFGEGDKAVKKPQLAFVQELLQGLPKQVEFSERGAPGAPGADVDVASFGENVDEDRLEIHRQATAISKDKGIPYREAVRQVITKE